MTPKSLIQNLQILSYNTKSKTIYYTVHHQQGVLPERFAAPLCTRVYPCVPLFTPAYPCEPMCTPVYPFVPLCTPDKKQKNLPQKDTSPLIPPNIRREQLKALLSPFFSFQIVKMDIYLYSIVLAWWRPKLKLNVYAVQWMRLRGRFQRCQ